MIFINVRVKTLIRPPSQRIVTESYYQVLWGAKPNFCAYLRPWFFMLEFVFFIFVELFHKHARREN